MRGVGGALLVLESTGVFIYKAEQVSMMLVDACNGFNNLRRLVVMWTVQHRWLVGVRFAFNYKHYMHLLIQ